MKPPESALVTVARASVAGEIDAATIDRLVESVRSLPVGERHLDASGVSFAGAAALGALVRLARESAGEGGRLTIRPSAALLRVAAICGLERTLFRV